MEKLGYINEREILYQKHDTEINWSKFLPDSNWLFVGLVETDNSNILDEISRKMIDNDVCYACCIGTFGEKMHDLIDENLVIRETERVCKLNSVWPISSFISNVSFFLKDSTLISFFEQDQGSVKGGDLRSRLYTLDRFLSLSTFAFQS